MTSVSSQLTIDARITRRDLLFGAATSALLLSPSAAFASAAASTATTECPTGTNCGAPLKISDLELIELHGRYDTEAGINGQPQVNPLDIYDDSRAPEYHDNPHGTRQVNYEAIYLRIRTEAGLDGLYGPIERDAAIVVKEDLRPFLIGKDALAGEALWDKMYRSNRHSRAGFFLMAISAVDNALWDLRARRYGVPVYRLLGGPTLRRSGLSITGRPDASICRGVCQLSRLFRGT
jgi:L-rhamnonate dehydratase